MKAPSSTSAAEARVEFQFSKGTTTTRQPGETRKVPAPPTGAASDAPPQVSRATQLLVVGYFFEHLVHEGKVRDYAEIARLTGLTRARVTQIIDLTLLPSDRGTRILLVDEVVRQPACGSGSSEGLAGG